MDDQRRGTAKGGGLFFTGEFNSKLILGDLIYDITRRRPVVLYGNISKETWTLYARFSSPHEFEKLNIFYIPTCRINIQGHIRCDLIKQNKLNIVRLEIDDGLRKDYIDCRTKAQNFKICVQVHPHEKTMTMWMNGSSSSVKKIHNIYFCRAEPNVVIFNKFGEIEIKEAKVWVDKDSDALTNTQRRLLTE